MCKYLFVVLLLACSFVLHAQVNLVPNPSFEDTISCPLFLGEIGKTEYWSSFANTVDYFTGCSNPCLQTPNACFGYQVPSTGKAYAGLITATIGTTNYREYLGVKLDSALTIGTKYYISLSITNGGNIGAQLATNNFGFIFSTKSYSQTVPFSIQNWSHGHFLNIISDTLAWTKKVFVFTADSNYQYLILGNFFSDSLTSFYNYGVNNQEGYYYIDDVIVTSDSSIVSVPEINFGNSIYCVFNGQHNLQIFGLPLGDYKYSIYSVAGQVLTNGDLTEEGIISNLLDSNISVLIVHIYGHNLSYSIKLINNKYEK